MLVSLLLVRFKTHHCWPLHTHNGWQFDWMGWEILVFVKAVVLLWQPTQQMLLSQKQLLLYICVHFVQPGPDWGMWGLLMVVIRMEFLFDKIITPFLSPLIALQIVSPVTIRVVVIDCIQLKNLVAHRELGYHVAVTRLLLSDQGMPIIFGLFSQTWLSRRDPFRGCFCLLILWLRQHAFQLL